MENLLEMEVAELRKLAEERGLSTTGNKQQLIKRITEAAAGGATQADPNAANDTAQDTAPDAASDANQDAEVAPETAPVEEAKMKFRVTPKNGVGSILGGYGVPGEGMLVPEGHPVLKFDYFLDIVELED